MGLFAAALFVMGLLVGDWRSIPQGLAAIFRSQDVLITDYVALAGPAAAFFNVALVVVETLLVLGLSGDPVNGSSFAVLGLMSGFAFFGKNVVNTLPILAGTWLYSRFRREPFGKYAAIGLMAGALGPMVSFFAFSPGWGHRLLGLGIGLLIGFVLPPLSAYTFRIQNGMNLYNMGFACGLLALVLMPVMTALGRAPEKTLLWDTGYRWPMAAFLALLSAALVAAGTILGGREGWREYGRILKTTGRAPSDYVLRNGMGASLLNMGMNGFLCLGFVLGTGSDLTGPVLGGILSVMGFSANGKHTGNIWPIMAGVALGARALHSPGNASVQLAMFFGTCLAPVSGCFGWPVGILAGFLHSAIVLRAGIPAEGVNLYNNGFSAGLLAIFLYGLLTPLLKRRRPTLQDEDYMEALLEDEETVRAQEEDED